MPLIFHEVEDDNEDTRSMGTSVEALLKEGVLSKKVLRETGRLPISENPYDREIANLQLDKSKSLQHREEWRNARKEALKDNPDSLQRVLAEDQESTWWNNSKKISDDSMFYKPGTPWSREEHVFFGYDDHPSSSRDWVAVEASEHALLHDACRDQGNPKDWTRNAVTIAQYQNLQAQGRLPYGWYSKYNEHLIRDAVSPERIVAYAKVEKEFPVGKGKFSDQQTQQVQEFIDKNLKFATQFTDIKDNVLLHEEDGKQKIRVSFNKQKITGRQQEVTDFFDQFSSMQQFAEAAQAELSPKPQTLPEVQLPGPSRDVIEPLSQGTQLIPKPPITPGLDTQVTQTSWWRSACCPGSSPSPPPNLGNSGVDR